MISVGFCIISKFCVECFDVSEVTRESVVQKGNCFVEGINEVELRSSHEKSIYNRTHNKN